MHRARLETQSYVLENEILREWGAVMVILPKMIIEWGIWEPTNREASDENVR